MNEIKGGLNDDRPHETETRLKVIHRRIKSPRDYNYIKILRFFLRFVSGWPLKEFGEKMLFCEGKYQGAYNTGLSTLFFISQVWYMAEHSSHLSFVELGHMYVSTLMNMVSSSRCCLLSISKDYKSLAIRFLTETHIFFYKDRSDYSREIYFKVHRLCNWFSGYLVTMFLLACVLFCAVPPYINYKKGKFQTLDDPVNTTYELSLYFKLPFDPERSFRGYCYSLALNWYAAFLCGTSILMFDLFLSIMIFNLWGHFKILLHTLATFPIPAALKDDGSTSSQRDAVMYSSIEQATITDKLKDSIRYHRMIIDFTNQMSEAFGMVLFLYYTFHQVSGCLLLLECFQGPEALARYLPLTILMTAQLVQISIIFEIIGSMSEKIKDGVYCLPWEYMNTKNRKTVLLFLINVQEPVHVKAGGLVDVGVTTMAGILKATLSYFAFLRTMN